MNKQWTLADVPSQAGKRFFITGGNSGVGYYAAVELARRGATVVLACRDKARGEAALQKLRVDAAGPNSAAAVAELIELDLASLDSVRRVAEDVVARGIAIDGLINNAGVMAPAKRLETKDGFELQFGTNVLGHFALTCRMLPVVRESVVTVASIAHKRGRIAFEDLQSKASYNPMRAYQQSKLGDLMFAFELQRRLRAAGSAVKSVAVHPGVAETSLFKVGSGKGLAATAEKVLQRSLGIFVQLGAGWRVADDLRGDFRGGQGRCVLRSAGVSGDARRRCGRGVCIEGGAGRGGARAVVGGVRGADGSGFPSLTLGYRPTHRRFAMSGAPAFSRVGGGIWAPSPTTGAWGRMSGRPSGSSGTVLRPAGGCGSRRTGCRSATPFWRGRRHRRAWRRRSGDRRCGWSWARHCPLVRIGRRRGNGKIFVSRLKCTRTACAERSAAAGWVRPGPDL